MGEKYEDTLKNALISITKTRQDIGEKEFRKILALLGAGLKNTKHASELVRSFDENTGQFIKPYRRIMKIIGDDRLSRMKFKRCVFNFKPGERGQRGGLKKYANELRKERDTIADLLKVYRRIRKIKAKLSDDEGNKFTNLEETIPKPIRDLLINSITNGQGKTRPAYKDIAIDWMIRHYPCTKDTLIQIIRESSND